MSGTDALRTALVSDGLLGEHSEHLSAHLSSLMLLPSREAQLAMLKEQCGIPKLGQRIKIVHHLERARTALPLPDVSDVDFHTAHLSVHAAAPAVQDSGTAAASTMPSSSTQGSQRWRVAHFPGVAVRTAPSLSSPKAAERLVSTWTEVEVAEVTDGWARLIPSALESQVSSRGEQWMLVDGEHAGIGHSLMQPIEAEHAVALDEARRLVREANLMVETVTDSKATFDGRGKQLVRALDGLRAARELVADLPTAVAEREQMLVRRQLCVAYACLHPEALLLPVRDVSSQALRGPLPSAPNAHDPSTPAASSSGAAASISDDTRGREPLSPPSLASRAYQASAADCVHSVHLAAWEIVHAGHEVSQHLRKICPSHFGMWQEVMSFMSVAIAALGWLDLPKLVPNGVSKALDDLDAEIRARRDRLHPTPPTRQPLLDEIRNLSASLVDDGSTLNSWAAHVFASFATEAGIKEMASSGLVVRTDVERCRADEFAVAIRQVASELDLQTPAYALDSSVGGELVGGGSDGDGPQRHLADDWDADSHGGRDSQIISTAASVIYRAVHLGLMHHMKKQFERGLVARMRLAPGESGGRYRCVAPERLRSAGLRSLIAPSDVEELRRERIVVIDDVIEPGLLRMAQAEAKAFAAEGAMKGEHNATCNPGEVSIELGLWDEGVLRALEKNRPGLYHCIRSLWNLPSMLGPALDLQMRVPQTVLLASYPPGALYHRHYDSYGGKDIPRLITVLLYLIWDPQRGGQLRALNSGPPGEPREPFDIEPRPGRLCVFYSQEVEHQVLSSEGDRYALTLWIWDVRKDSSGR